MSNAQGHAQFCRERVLSHKRQAQESSDADRRRFHEKEASSWKQEQMFYEAWAGAEKSRV